MTTLKKTLAATLSAVVLAGSLAATATPASARYGRNAAFFGGLVGGLAVGALAAGAYNGGYYGGDCYFDRRPVYNHWGDMIGYRRIRVCD
jgi:predicted lipid-binding transport protein (Tim44 family)